MCCIDEGMRRADESFRKAEAAYERDSGLNTGTDAFECPVCGRNFTLRWREEYGQGEYIDDPNCPECGWPVTEDQQGPGFYESGPYDESCYQAPCPVCGRVVIPKGESFSMYHLECGHWVRICKWHDYADAYDAFEEGDIGLSGSDYRTFIRKHPEAGKTEKRTS